MFKNSKDDLFGPLRVPRLLEVGRTEIQEFLCQVRAYRMHQDTRRNAGESVETLKLRFLVEPALLRTIETYEMGLKDHEELSSDQLEEYLIKSLQPSDTYVPSVSKLFGKLKLETSGDAKQRVVNLFKAADKIIVNHGLQGVEDKVIAKQIIRAIEPRELRELIQDDIVLRGKDNYYDRAKLFQLVVRHVEGAVCYGDKLGEASERRKFSREEKKNPRKRKVLECYACKGKHLIWDCTTCSSQEKRRIMTMPWRDREDFKVSRELIKNKEKSQAGKEEKEQRSGSARVLKVGDGTKETGEIRHAILAGVDQSIRYRLDSGADFSTISEGMLRQIMKKTFILTRACTKPKLCELGDGTILQIQRVALMDVALLTRHGSVVLRQVELHVLPGRAEELLIGRPELERLKLPNLERALEAMAAAQNGTTTHAPTDAKDRASYELLTGIRQVGDEELQLHRKEIVKAVRGLGDDHRGTSAGDTDSDEEAPLLTNCGPPDQEAIGIAIEEMLGRARKEGAPEGFMEAIRQVVYHYEDVWRVELGADPPAAVTPLSLQLIDQSVVPKAFRVRPLAELQREFLSQHVRTLLEAGVIERSRSEFSSPVVLVRKPDTSWRMCIDLRYVNSLTRPMRYPLPRINELLTHLAGATVFASFDMVKGFWQFPLDPESRHFFAFATHEGLFQFKRVVMGARNAATHFQAVMTELLEERTFHDTLLYLDDILTYARTWEALVEAIVFFLDKAAEVGIKLQPKKCELFVKETIWCGHHISERGVSVNPEFVDTLLAMPTPTTAADIQQFLAATNWIRGRIPEYARIVGPLQDLLQTALAGKKRRTKRIAAGVRLRDIGWGPVHEASFRQVRAAIAEAVTVAHPDPEKHFCLFTDASQEFWASVLTQIPAEEADLPTEEQAHEPLAFLSGTFRGAQIRWAIPDKEGYAIKESCVKLCHLLVRRKGFSIHTDHRNLLYIFNPQGFAASVPKPTADRLERWAVLLRCFDYEINHIEGPRNVWADLLSRWGAPGAAIRRVARVSFRLEADRVQTENILETFEGEDHPPQESWPQMEEILEAQGQVSAATREELGLRMHEGVLVAPTGDAVFVPDDPPHLRIRLMLVGYAGAAGHRGIRATQEAVTARFWWPGARGEVDQFVRQCLLCVKSRGGG